ncbi:MAG: hypothetical protein AAF997_05675 [Myxococcota bacterium]
MAEESDDRRVMIAILLASTLLTMLGIIGILSGTNVLWAKPIPENLSDFFSEEADGANPASREVQIAVQFREAEASDPYRRPMAAANVIVSALVLIGSFLLSWRRRLAQWWVRQAVIAKLIWIVGSTAAFVQHLEGVFPSLPPPSAGGGTLSELTWYTIALAAISAVLHALAAWRVSRPDIGEFIETSSRG